jgi:hypothetical protein
MVAKGNHPLERFAKIVGMDQKPDKGMALDLDKLRQREMIAIAMEFGMDPAHPDILKKYPPGSAGKIFHLENNLQKKAQKKDGRGEGVMVKKGELGAKIKKFIEKCFREKELLNNPQHPVL